MLISYKYNFVYSLVDKKTKKTRRNIVWLIELKKGATDTEPNQ